MGICAAGCNGEAACVCVSIKQHDNNRRTMGKKQKKGFEDSAKDDVDIDALAAEIEGAGGAAKEQTKGKKKKKGAKKEDYDEDDILKELEELSLETTGGKKDTTEEVQVEPARQEKKKTRKGKKGV